MSGAWVEMTPEELSAYMRDVLHELALQENRMTRRQRLDEWLRVRYWEEYIAAGCPKNFVSSLEKIL